MGVVYPFFSRLEFDKNANSIDVSTYKCFSYRYSLATIGVCVFCATASVVALFLCLKVDCISIWQEVVLLLKEEI